MKSLGRAGCVVIVFLLVVADAMGPARLTNGTLNDYVSVPAIAVVALVLAAFYVVIFKARPFMEPPDQFPREDVDPIHSAKLRSFAENEADVDTLQSKIFGLVVAEPSAVRQRVVEDYVPDHRTLRQTVTIAARIPKKLLPVNADGTETVYFPALLAEKGELQDGFDVYTESGDPAIVLNYREYLRLASAALHAFLLAAYRLRVGEPLPPVAREAELHAIEDMMSRRLIGSPPPTYRGAREIAQLRVENAAIRDLAAKVVQRLTTHYAVVMLVSGHRKGRFVVKYSRTLIPSAKLSESGTKRRLTFPAWLRQMLGARPVVINIELDNASTCQSYHLRIDGLDGLYLASQQALDMKQLVKRTAKDAPTPPHCRFRRKLGQSHAHFYARYFPDRVDTERPRLEFKYYETPPGSTFRAAVNAFACLALVWFAGMMSVLSVAGSASATSDPKSDIPAILLAFPAAAASWIGFEAPTGRLFEGTLTARFCLVATAVLSLASSGLYMARYIQGKSFLPGSLPYGLSFLGLADVAWSTLVFLAMVNAVYIGYRTCFAGWCYAWLATRVDEPRPPKE